MDILDLGLNQDHPKRIEIILTNRIWNNENEDTYSSEAFGGSTESIVINITSTNDNDWFSTVVIGTEVQNLVGSRIKDSRGCTEWRISQSSSLVL